MLTLLSWGQVFVEGDSTSLLRCSRVLGYDEHRDPSTDIPFRQPLYVHVPMLLLCDRETHASLNPFSLSCSNTDLADS